MCVSENPTRLKINVRPNVPDWNWARSLSKSVMLLVKMFYLLRIPLKYKY